MGRGSSKAGGGKSKPGGGGGKIASKTQEQVRNMTNDQLNKGGLGKLQSFGTKRNADGTLAYATFKDTETVKASDIDIRKLNSDPKGQFKQWAQKKEPGIKYSSIDIDGKNNITAWKSNGDKDFFVVTGGKRSIENYIELNTLHGKKWSDKVRVQTKKDNWIDLDFKYVGSKKY